MMKHLLKLSLAGLLLVAAPALAKTLIAVQDAAEAAATAKIGQPAPDFTLTDTNGNTHNLTDHRGQIVVLEWTNHDCPFVKKHYETGNMQALQKEAAEQGAVWLTINSSAPGKQGYTTPEEANAIIAETGAAAAARLLDPEGAVGRLYEAKTTPHMYVIDPEGVLVYAGAIDDNPSSDHKTVKTAHNYVRAALESLAKNEPVETALTQAYGCAVKYGS